MFSVVKMMKEQGNQFDWSQIAIDIPSLPCFKPESEWPEYTGEPRSIATLLADGYAVVKGHVVKVTGENPNITFSDTGAPYFYQVGNYVDCEPVVVADEMASLVPARFFHAAMNTGYVDMPTENIVSGPEDSWYAFPEVVDGVLKYVLAGHWSNLG